MNQKLVPFFWVQNHRAKPRFHLSVSRPRTRDHGQDALPHDVPLGRNRGRVGSTEMQNPWFSTWIHVESYSGQWFTNLPSPDLEGMFLRAAWLAHSHHWKPPQRAGNTCHQGTCWSEISPRLITTGGDISLGSFSQQTIFFLMGTQWGYNREKLACRGVRHFRTPSFTQVSNECC